MNEGRVWEREGQIHRYKQTGTCPDMHQERQTDRNRCTKNDTHRGTDASREEDGQTRIDAPREKDGQTGTDAAKETDAHTRSFTLRQTDRDRCTERDGRGQMHRERRMDRKGQLN